MNLHKRMAIILSVALTILVSCQSPKRPWMSGHKVSDRLMETFDSIEKIKFRDTLLLKSYADRMAVLGEKDSLSKGRYYFMLAHISKLKQNDSLTLLYAEKARNLIDSASYPYDRARVDMEDDILIYKDEKQHDKLYYGIKRNLYVCQEYNDSNNIAASYMRLGVIHDKLGDYENALKNSRAAQEIWEKMGNEKSLFRIGRNIIHTLKMLDRNKEAYLLADSLTHNPFFKNDLATSCLVLADMYDYNKDHRLLLRSFDMTMKMCEYLPETSTPAGYVASKLGLYYLRHGQIDSAEYYEKYSDRSIDDGRNTYKEMFELKRDLQDTLGYKEAAAYTDSFLKQLHHDYERYQKLHQLQNSMLIENIDKINETMKKEKEDSANRLRVIFISVIVLIVLTAFFVFRMVRRKSRKKERKLNRDLSNTQSQLAIAHIKNAEKDTALSKALTDIKGISDDSEVKSKSHKIATDIKRVMNTESDWEKFQITFSENNPEFVNELKKRNPALTKGDIRLACMIKMGMDTKHIAKVLAINADSVKKNRQRLRAKLDIPSDITLPDYLASIVSEE